MSPGMWRRVISRFITYVSEALTTLNIGSEAQTELGKSDNVGQAQGCGWTY